MGFTHEILGPATLQIGLTTYEGIRARFPCWQPWSGDTSAEADAWRARNAGKTFTYRRFTDIRFATAERWKAPVLHSPGNVTIDASEFGAVCPQKFPREAYDDLGPNSFEGRDQGKDDGPWYWAGYGPKVHESEDCLRVQIWMPDEDPPVGGWPCVVFIHGGGNSVGTSIAYGNWGNWVAARGVVQINISYRLAFFGSFYHPDYAAEPDWEGPHFAHMDRLAALEWINDHAADLSIDTSKITITGGSAGGQAILYLLGDSASHGFYARAWARSGGGVGRLVKETPDWVYPAYPDICDQALRAVQSAPRLQGQDGKFVASIAATDGWPAALRAMRASSVNHLHAEGFDRNNFLFFGDSATFPHRHPLAAVEAGAWPDIPTVHSYANGEFSLVGIGSTTNTLSQTPSGRMRMANQNWLEVQNTAPWTGWTTQQQNRVAWRQGYELGAHAICHALAEQDRDAWWVVENYLATEASGDYCGHTYLGPAAHFQVPWMTRWSNDGTQIRIEEKDLRAAWLCMEALLALTANGDLAVPFGGNDLGLWETPPSHAGWVKYDTTNRAANIIGFVDPLVARTSPDNSPAAVNVENLWLDDMLTLLRGQPK